MCNNNSNLNSTRLCFCYDDDFQANWLNLSIVNKDKGFYNYNPNCGIPFLGDKFDAIYLRGILERLIEDRQDYLLKECYRTMKDGATIRIAIKDLKKICKNYVEELEKAQSSNQSSLKLDVARELLLDRLTREKKGGNILDTVKESNNEKLGYLKENIGNYEVKKLTNEEQGEKQEDLTCVPKINNELFYSCDKFLTYLDFYSLKTLLENAGFINVTQKEFNTSLSKDFSDTNFDKDENQNQKHLDEIFIEATKPASLNKNNEEKIKVAMFNTYGTGGAANAALRQHYALRKIGIDSICYTADQKQDTRKFVYPCVTDNSYLKVKDDGEIIIDKFSNEIEYWLDELNQYPNKGSFSEYCPKTLNSINPNNIPFFDDFDIINLEWVAGFVDPSEHPEIFEGKTLVWTLHDEQPFTGGCHYAAKCQNFKTQGCKGCPILNSGTNNDISTRNFEKRLKAYEKLDLHIVAPSQWMANEAKQSPLFAKFPVSVIQYAQPLDIYKPLNKAELRKEAGLNPSDIVILFVAASVESERKGFKYLYNMLEMLASTKLAPQVVLYVMGSNPPEDDIASLGFRFKCFGNVTSQEEAAILYNLADVLIVPSLEDNSPNTICESLGCGTPVIAFDSGGISEMIVHKKTGYLAKKEDCEDLLNGIVWLLESKKDNEGKAVSEACRQFALEHYSEETQAKKYLSLYESLVNKNKKNKNENLDELKAKNTKSIFKEDEDIISATKNLLKESETNKESNNGNLSVKITNQKIRVAVDGRGLSYSSNFFRGIGHYTMNLLRTLASDFKDEVSLTMYFDEQVNIESIKEAAKLDNIDDFRHYPRTRPLDNDMFFIPDLMSLIPGYASGFDFRPGLPTSLLFYDFTPINFHQYFDGWPESMQQEYLRRMEEIKKYRPQMLAISEFTKQDIVKYLGIPEKDIFVIMAGLNESKILQGHTIEDAKEVLEKFNLKSPFFLSVGGCDRHKNTELSISGIISLQAAFLNEGKNIIPQLVIIGDLKDPFKVAYKKLLESKGFTNFIFTGYVTQKELGCMYSKATALLYPSLWEGFGFPVLEAMANKCPVITSKRTSLPEVGGDAVYYVNDLNQEEITKAMKELVENNNLRNELREKGFEQSKLFSWDKTAQKAINAWKELARR